MKSHLAEVALALVLGAIWLALLLVQNLHNPFPQWRGVLSLFVFCVFAVYLAIVDDQSRPRRSGEVRIFAGIVSGVTIAAINQFQAEGYVVSAFAGALLGWCGIFWVKHL